MVSGRLEKARRRAATAAGTRRDVIDNMVDVIDFFVICQQSCVRRRHEEVLDPAFGARRVGPRAKFEHVAEQRAAEDCRNGARAGPAADADYESAATAATTAATAAAAGDAAHAAGRQQRRLECERLEQL